MAGQSVRVSLLLLLAVCKVRAQEPTAVVTPPGFNASLGSTTIFRCEVFGANEIGWLVNDLSVSRPEVAARNITESLLEIINSSSGQFMSFLTVPATLGNNNITVRCAAQVSGGAGQLSDEVRYFVQGILDPPTNLQIATDPTDNAQRVITWDIPETLDITDVEDDISGYTICNNISDTCSSSSEAQYTFPNLRIPLQFTVTALNIVGESAPSVAMVHEACDADTEGSVDQLPGEDENCSNAFVIETTPSSGTDTTNHGVIFPTLSQREEDGIEQQLINAIIDSNLESNLVYTAAIVSRNINGDANSTGVITFTTYDVQALQASAVPGGIEITCTFAQGTEAQGCHIIITGVGMQLIVNAFRDLQTQTATHMEMDLNVGSYIVSVFDLESDSTISTVIAVETQEVSVTEDQPTMRSSPTPDTQESSPTEPDTQSSNTAVIIGSVVGGLLGICAIAVMLLVAFIPCNKARKQRKVKTDIQVRSDGAGVIYEEPDFPDLNVNEPGSHYSLPLPTDSCIAYGVIRNT